MLEFAPAPDERSATGQHRRQGGPLEGRIAGALLRNVISGFQPELKNVFRSREVAQLARPQIGQHDIVGQ